MKMKKLFTTTILFTILILISNDGFSQMEFAIQSIKKYKEKSLMAKNQQKELSQSTHQTKASKLINEDNDHVLNTNALSTDGSLMHMESTLILFTMPILT